MGHQITTFDIAGLAILAGAYYYLKIVRPKKAIASPTDLEIYPQLTSDQINIHPVIAEVVGNSYLIKTDVNFDKLIHSPKLGKVPAFKNHLRNLSVSYMLLDTKTSYPVMAIDVDSYLSDEAARYLTLAGIPFCTFPHNEDKEKLKADLTTALNQVQEMERVTA